MSRFTAPSAEARLVGRFAITYGAINRLWCNACDKHENLPDLADATVQRLQTEHVCGPGTSPWTSSGVS